MNALQYFVAPLVALVSFSCPSAYAACPDFDNKTVVIDFGKAERFNVKNPDAGWETASLADFKLGKVYSPETGCLTLQFKQKNNVKWTAPGKIPMRCTYKLRGLQTVEITVRDEDEEEEGSFSMSLWVVFHTGDEGIATGEVWFCGRTYCLKGVEVHLQNSKTKKN